MASAASAASARPEEDPAVRAATGSAYEYAQLKLIKDDIVSEEPNELTILFTLDGKDYRTIFNKSNSVFNGKKSFYITNKCIDLEYRPASNTWITGIKKNTEDIKAFKAGDVLFGSTLDMLQILATKLRLCMPAVHLDSIKITDEAKIVPGTYLSDFKILRGGRPVYEKYGYASPMKDTWDHISAKAGSIGSWEDVKKLLEKETVDAINAFVAAKHIVVPKDPSITDIMKQIAIEDDTFSTPIVEALYKEKEGGRVLSRFRSFVLAAASDAWTTSKRRLIITSVEKAAAGGYRTTKRRKQKQQRQQSLNKERTNSNNGRTLQTTRARKGRKRR